MAQNFPKVKTAKKTYIMICLKSNVGFFLPSATCFFFFPPSPLFLSFVFK